MNAVFKLLILQPVPTASDLLIWCACRWRVAHKWPGAAKYSIHYLAFSPNVPHYCYVAGQDYECVARRWDGSAGVTSGNANSVAGSGHGRAVGPAGFIPGEAAAFVPEDGHAAPPGAGEELWSACT